MDKTKLATIICAWIAALMIIGAAAWLIAAQIGSETLGRYGIISGVTIENLPDEFRQIGSYSLPPEEIFAIYIDWVAGEVSLGPHDGTDVLVTEFAQRELADYERFDVSHVYGIVVINFRGGYGGFRSIPPKKLEVLVPEKLLENLERIRVESVSAQLNINNVSTVDIYTRTVYGGQLISNVTAQTLRVISTSGMKDIAGTFENVDLSTSSGRVSLQSYVVPQTLSIYTYSGSVDITVPHYIESPITVSHYSVSGKFSSELPTLMLSGEARFRISTTSGDVNIFQLRQ